MGEAILKRKAGVQEQVPVGASSIAEKQPVDMKGREKSRKNKY